MSRTKTTLLLAAALVTLATVEQLHASTVFVGTFGIDGWNNGDTRNDSGTNVGPTGRVDLNIAPPATSPSGYNALRLTTGGLSSKATLNQGGLNLGTIADFSGTYNWYKTTTGVPAPALRLGIDTTDSNPASSRPDEANFDKFLVYEPYDNPFVNLSHDPGTNVWVTQTFSLNSGTWWLRDRNTSSNVNTPPTSLTLQQWLNDGTYGTLLTTGTIVAVQLGIGSGHLNLTAYVDELSYTYGLSPTSMTYYFVPEPSSFALAGIAFAGLGYVVRRRNARRLVTA